MSMDITYSPSLKRFIELHASTPSHLSDEVIIAEAVAIMRSEGVDIPDDNVEVFKQQIRTELSIARLSLTAKAVRKDYRRDVE